LRCFWQAQIADSPADAYGVDLTRNRTTELPRSAIGERRSLDVIEPHRRV